MGQEKTVLSVEEAKEQLRLSASQVNFKEIWTDNMWPITIGSIAAGAVAAKTRSVSLVLTGISFTMIRKLINKIRNNGC
jgi:uncharacterized protein (DUF2062 family)